MKKLSFLAIPMLMLLPIVSAVLFCVLHSSVFDRFQYNEYISSWLTVIFSVLMTYLASYLRSGDRDESVWILLTALLHTIIFLVFFIPSPDILDVPVITQSTSFSSLYLANIIYLYCTGIIQFIKQ